METCEQLRNLYNKKISFRRLDCSLDKSMPILVILLGSFWRNIGLYKCNTFQTHQTELRVTLSCFLNWKFISWVRRLYLKSDNATTHHIKDVSTNAKLLEKNMLNLKRTILKKIKASFIRLSW